MRGKGHCQDDYLEPSEIEQLASNQLFSSSQQKTSNQENRRIWDFLEMQDMSLRANITSSASEQPVQLYMVACISYSPTVYAQLTPVSNTIAVVPSTSKKRRKRPGSMNKKTKPKTMQQHH